MKSTFFMSIIFCILFFSCKKTTFQENDTVYLVGNVSNFQGVEIALSKGLSPTKEYLYKDIPTTFYINNAKVDLYEEDTKIQSLISKGEGKYRNIDTLWKPIVGKKYKIVADVPQYGIAESELVIFPEAAKLEKFSYILQPYFGNSGNPTNAPLARMVIDIKTDLTKTQFYELEHNSFTVNAAKMYNSYFLSEENVELNEKKAYECGRLFYNNKSDNTAFTNDCLIDNKYYEYMLMIGSAKGVPNTTPIGKMEVKLNTISESYHKYRTNLFRQGDIDERFQEVPPSYTNIKNGIGIFYARNEGDKVFVVKP